MKKTMEFLRPNLIRLLITLALVILMMLVVVDYHWTSKVSWEENRGIPLSVLTLNGYYGPCPPLGACKECSIESFRPLALLFDSIISYAVGCMIMAGIDYLRRR
jgi:hypothetical protein